MENLKVKVARNNMLLFVFRLVYYRRLIFCSVFRNISNIYIHMCVIALLPILVIIIILIFFC